jgi:putative ABC transport system permease protein
MAIPFKYNLGNLTSRRVSVLLTILGIGVVNAVMISMLALAHGVSKMTVTSGSKTDLIVLRESAETELTSWVSVDAYRIISTLPGVAKNEKGQPLVSPELLILFKLPRKDGKASNVQVRGITATGVEMRGVKLVEGRMFRPGVNEVVVGKRIHDRFANMNVGDTLHFGTHDYRVTGVFDAHGSGFDSELWADETFLAQSRKRTSYSTLIVRPDSPASSAAVKAAIQNDNRLKLQVKSERQYYASQMVGLFGIFVLVGFVSLGMIAGAVLGTMNTMFSAVASRTRELATMRALGFKRRSVLLSIMLESALVSLLGAVAGLVLAFPVNGISTGTTNFKTFSEISFSFTIDGQVAMMSLIIALVAGVIGGVLPALRAAFFIPITTALREI